MSLRDLVETDCGGSSSIVKLSTHFVEDHAFKDQDLKQPLESESNENAFLKISNREVNISKIAQKMRNNLFICFPPP